MNIKSTRPYIFFVFVFALVFLSCNDLSSGDPPDGGTVVLFEDDFEDQSIADWDVHAPSDYTITFPAVSGLSGGSAASGSNYCMAITDTAGMQNYDGIHKDLGNIAPSYISFYRRVGTTIGSYNYFVLGTGTSGTDTETISTAVVNGNASLNGSGSPTIDYQIDANTWYHVEIKDIDWTNHTVDLYIDGILVKDNFPFRVDSSFIRYLCIFNYNITNVSYIDDILIY